MPSLKAKLPVFVIFTVEFVVEKDRVLPSVTAPFSVSAVLVVAPRPVTVDKVSASEVRGELVVVMVMVEPLVLMVVPPEPEMVKAPAKLLTEGTMAVVSTATVGFWPVLTVIPVPPSKE